MRRRTLFLAAAAPAVPKAAPARMPWPGEIPAARLAAFRGTLPQLGATGEAALARMAAAYAAGLDSTVSAAARTTCSAASALGSVWPAMGSDRTPMVAGAGAGSQQPGAGPVPFALPVPSSTGSAASAGGADTPCGHGGGGGPSGSPAASLSPSDPPVLRAGAVPHASQHEGTA